MAFATTALVVAGASTAMGLFSGYSSAKTANMSAKAQEKEAKRRYALQAGTTKNQLEEQRGIARDKMTEISKQFLAASGSMQAASGESLTGGNVRSRIKRDLGSKESEASIQKLSEVNTNVINIAQGMLAEKIDTEAIIGQARLSKKNVLMETAMGALQGVSSGSSSMSGLKSLNIVRS